MFLNTQLLKFDKFGASGLQIETTSRFVGHTLLAGTHDEGHEGGRLNLRDNTRVCDVFQYGHRIRGREQQDEIQTSLTG